MGTSHGIDVSAYQGAQDWASLARDGLTFAFAKASEGQHTHDERFAGHISGIIAAGLIPGAYHYGWPTQSPATEAANYTEAVKPYARKGFIHILDLERRSDGANYAGRTATQIKIWAHAWIAWVKQTHPGQRVGIYTSASDISAGQLPDNADALWYPAYPSGAMTYAQAEAHARPAPSGRTPLFWQFTSTPIDRSIAYLTPTALRTWALGNSTPQEDDMPTAAEIATAVWNHTETGPAGSKPVRMGAVLGWMDTVHGGQNRALATATAELGALKATVAELAADGGLTAEQITAAAQAGATAALDQLGDALTKEGA
jgi:GH25 family lysozyme M1 (1,4-beta-N-acetylmuramidase)